MNKIDTQTNKIITFLLLIISNLLILISFIIAGIPDKGAKIIILLLALFLLVVGNSFLYKCIKIISIHLYDYYISVNLIIVGIVLILYGLNVWLSYLKVINTFNLNPYFVNKSNIHWSIFPGVIYCSIGIILLYKSKNK